MADQSSGKLTDARHGLANEEARQPLENESHGARRALAAVALRTASESRLVVGEVGTAARCDFCRRVGKLGPDRRARARGVPLLCVGGFTMSDGGGSYFNGSACYTLGLVTVPINGAIPLSTPVADGGYTAPAF